MKLSFRSKLFLTFLGFAVLLSGVLVGLLYSVTTSIPNRVISGIAGATALQVAHQMDPGEIKRWLALQSKRLEQEPRQAPHEDPDPQTTERLKVALTQARDALVQGSESLSVGQNVGQALGWQLLGFDLFLAQANRDWTGRIVLATNSSMQADEIFFEPVGLDRNHIDVDRLRLLRSEAAAAPVWRAAPIFDEHQQIVALVGVQAHGRLFNLARTSMLTLVGVIFVVVLMVSIGFAMIVARRLNAPINRLITAMNRVDAGDLNVAVHAPPSGDEFDKLISSFNHMIEGLRERADIKRSLALASEVQKQLLPREMASIPGYELAGDVDYCDETGGDYFDFIALEAAHVPCPAHHDADPGDPGDPGDPDAAHEAHPIAAPASSASRWGITIGDVTGHGVAPALLMAWTRAVLRTQAPLFGEQIDQLMQSVNRHLLRDAYENTFLTLFYAVLDPATGHMRWGSAGHDPALWYRARTHEVTELGAQDIPLGVMPTARFPMGSDLLLEPGDVLLLTTDGVSQARSRAGHYLGVDPIKQMLCECASQSAEQIRRRVTDCVRRHVANRPLEDDASIVVLRREAHHHVQATG